MGTEIETGDINRWIARRWLGIVVAAFAAGVMFTLVVVLIVLLMHASM